MRRIVVTVFLILVGLLFVLSWAASTPGPVSSCIVIDTPGEYTLSKNINGSPNDFQGGKACIVIDAPDVLLDCQNFHMNLNEPPGVNTYGIAINSVSNAKVYNCFIEGYTYGVYTIQSGNDEFINNSAQNNFQTGFYSESSGSSKYENNNGSHSVQGFYIKSGSDNTFTNNTASGNTEDGFLLQDASSNGFTENELYGNLRGFHLIQSSNSNNFSYNDIHDNTENAVLSESSSHNKYLRNLVNNSITGIQLTSGSNNEISNNNMDQMANQAVLVTSSTQNTFSNNNISNSVIGVASESSGNSYTNNIIHDSHNVALDIRFAGTGNGGSNSFTSNTIYNNARGFVIYSDGNTLTSNTAFNNNDSMRVEASSNTITGNTVYDSKIAAIEIKKGSFNVVRDNVLYRTNAGVHLSNTKKNTISENTAYENDFGGFVLDENSSENTLSGNIAYNNNPANLTLFGNFLFGGFIIFDGSNNNTLLNNIAYSNNQFGIGFMAPSFSNTVTSNIVANNSGYGFYVDGSNDNKFTTNEIAGNRTGRGIFIINSTGTTMDRDHFYKNSFDFAINSSLQSMDIKLKSVVFDAPEGKYENETVLSINDTLRKGDAYSIKWATNSTKPPEGRFSVKRKYVNMSTSVDLLIDAITWHWSDADTEGAVEDSFELWTYNGSWNLMSGFTVNTTTNNLNVSNVNASFYGILYANATAGDCQYVTVSLNFTPGCDQNIVALTAGGSPLSLADVTVLREGSIMALGSTDSNGKFFFNGTGASVEISVNKPRTATTCYSVPGAGKFSVNLKSPADCGRPECVANTDCSQGFVCSNNHCVPAAECTNDADCTSGKICTSGKCIEKPPLIGECTNDADCQSDKYCSAGNCTAVVTGTCGIIQNHAWVPYECCADSDCASGQICQGNTCTVGTYDLTGPVSGFLEDNITFTAYINSQPYANVQIKVTNPDKSTDTFTTDASGQVTIQLTQTGAYVMDLLVNNNLAKTLVVTSSPKQAPEALPFTVEGVVQIGLLLAFLLMVGAVLAFLVYYFFIGGKKVTKRKRR